MSRRDAASPPTIPRATYRMQFHKGFPLAQAIPLAPYLARLGISHLYASPILAARAGSLHGYDVIDHTRINPELGGEEGLRTLVAALRANDLGLIVDIVPNHMAVGGADNPWWLDVLERGPHSPDATMFDINWDPPDPTMRGKILAPFLGNELDNCLANNEIALIWDGNLGKFAFAYHDHRFPLRREDYAAFEDEGGKPSASALESWNTPARLKELLAHQHYRLAFWQTAPDKINWRRFFDITGLAALRVEDAAVFEAVHAELFRLYAAGLIDGMRVDHIDGLTDPTAYCIRLRERLDALAPQRPVGAPPGPAYLVVEKILASGEELPRIWPVHGTTGYDFMNDVSALQTDADGEPALTRLWTEFSGRPSDFETEEQDARHELLHDIFACEWRASASVFRRLALFAAREIDETAIEAALDLLIQHFRAYRTYATGREDTLPPGPIFARAVEAARIELTDTSGLDLVASAMQGEMVEFGKWSRESVRHLNQLTAPLAAKAVEDTAFYRYGRLLSRNDVGFEPGTFAISVDTFHDRARRRMMGFPHAMLATATHDHKRGEDLRARLAVLSEIPDIWETEVREWFRLNAAHSVVPLNRGDEYRLYQMIAGAWPLTLVPDDALGLSRFTERMLGWREKSLREAKLTTSWVAPNLAFESANAEFVRAILDPARARLFLERVATFVRGITPAGALNGLVQTLLRCTVPGVPDLYQGAEFWDFSMVDPDNRRPVDYAARTGAALQIGGEPPPIDEWRDGAIKQWLITRALALRSERAELFCDGTYVPIAARGARAAHVIAFLRRRDDAAVMVAAPLHCARACGDAPLPDAAFWGDTELALPEDTAWENGLGAPLAEARSCAQLFARFPGAILIAQ